jgi:hypothetical protein
MIGKTGVMDGKFAMNDSTEKTLAFAVEQAKHLLETQKLLMTPFEKYESNSSALDPQRQ